MPRIGISKQQVFDIAKQIASNGELPTVVKIRNLLSTGSIVTIQKYLKEWKKNCFNHNLSIDQNLHDLTNNLKSIEEHRNLKLMLEKKIAQNEHYAQELINVEKANIELKEQNLQLNFANQELQFKLRAAEKTNHALEQATQKIQKELNLNTNKTIEKMQQTIDDLRLELKTLNETSIAALRETSNQGHEALMQERVVSINLQIKIDSLTKELLDSKTQLNEVIMTSQIQIRSLSRQNEELQKIIQEHGLEKSPPLEEGVSLKFSNGVAVYEK